MKTNRRSRAQLADLFSRRISETPLRPLTTDVHREHAPERRNEMHRAAPRPALPGRHAGA